MDRRGRGDNGAVIVEAALVLPLLFLIVFGMIDFGVTLSDQISLREGVREGVRQAVVPGSLDDEDQPVDTAERVVAVTQKRIGLGSDAAVRVLVGIDPGAPAKAGDNVTVCAYVPMRSLSGLFSMALDDQYMFSKVTMRAEDDKTSLRSGGDGDPTGDDWSRCDVAP